MLSIDSWIKLNAQTAGKDKIFRLLQYLSRFLSHTIEGRKHLRDVVARLKIIEANFSVFRKLLRLGKSVDVLYGVLKSIHVSDPIIRMTVSLSRVYQAAFLLVDHLIWGSRAGLLQIDREKWTLTACKLWLGSIVLNLIRDAYEILNIVKKGRCIGPSTGAIPKLFPNSTPEIQSVNSFLATVPGIRAVALFAKDHPDVFWDTLKNACDIWIPMTALGKVSMSSGTVGLLGTISSFAGLVAVMDPMARLV